MKIISNDTIKILLVVLGFVVLLILINKIMMSVVQPMDESMNEDFMANYMETDILDATHDSPKDDIYTPHTHHLVKNYLSNREFIGMVYEIKKIMINKLVAYGKGCQEMNGDEVKLGDGNYALSLMCQNDPWVMEESIVLDITKYIRGFVQNKFNINLNPYSVIHDLMRNLNLLEAVIYPLKYSGLYTVHGIQYTNEDIISQKINYNLDVKDTLLTILGRRGITLLVDTDQQIQ